jgi:predicted lysophospholipase L1 biosynthesis ABC-type transport system permease subunit
VNGPVEVIGVVRDVRYSNIKRPVLPQLFTPRVPGNTSFGSRFFYVKAEIAPDSLLVRLPRIVAELDPSLPVANLELLERHGRNSVFGDRLVASLAASFAVLATLLTAIGLYGVLSYNLARRRRELGLRLALGAAPGRLLAAVLRQVATMACIGIAIGLAAGIALARLARGLLYEMSGHDPLVLATAVGVIAFAVLAASYFPARRASRLEPMQALRYE